MERSRVDRRVSCRAWKRAIVVAIGLSSVASTAVAATTADLTGQRVQVVYRDSGGATEQMIEGNVLVVKSHNVNGLRESQNLI